MLRRRLVFLASMHQCSQRDVLLPSQKHRGELALRLFLALARSLRITSVDRSLRKFCVSERTGVKPEEEGANDSRCVRSWWECPEQKEVQRVIARPN